MESKLFSTLEYLLSAVAGVVTRVVVELSRDIESLRGRMGAPQSTQQALGRACRDLEGLFESLLSESFGRGT